MAIDELPRLDRRLRAEAELAVAVIGDIKASLSRDAENEQKGHDPRAVRAAEDRIRAARPELNQ